MKRDEQASGGHLGVKAGSFEENISSEPSSINKMKQIPCQKNDQKRNRKQNREQHYALL